MPRSPSLRIEIPVPVPDAPRRCLPCDCLPWHPIYVPTGAAAQEKPPAPMLPSPPYRLSPETEGKHGVEADAPSVPEMAAEPDAPAPSVSVWVHVPVALFFALVVAVALVFENTAPTPAACAADDTACRTAAAAILVATALSDFTATPHIFNLLNDMYDPKTLFYAGLITCCQFCAVGNELIVIVNVMSATGVGLGAACLGGSVLLGAGVCVYAKHQNPRAYRLSTGTGLVGCCALLGITLGHVHVAVLPFFSVLAVLVGTASNYLHGGAVSGLLCTTPAGNTHGQEHAKDTKSMLLLAILLCKIMLARGFFCDGVYDVFEAIQSVTAFTMMAMVLLHTL